MKLEGFADPIKEKLRAGAGWPADRASEPDTPSTCGNTDDKKVAEFATDAKWEFTKQARHVRTPSFFPTKASNHSDKECFINSNETNNNNNFAGEVTWDSTAKVHCIDAKRDVVCEDEFINDARGKAIEVKHYDTTLKSENEGLLKNKDIVFSFNADNVAGYSGTKDNHWVQTNKGGFLFGADATEASTYKTCKELFGNDKGKVDGKRFAFGGERNGAKVSVECQGKLAECFSKEGNSMVFKGCDSRTINGGDEGAVGQVLFKESKGFSLCVDTAKESCQEVIDKVDYLDKIKKKGVKTEYAQRAAENGSHMATAGEEKALNSPVKINFDGGGLMASEGFSRTAYNQNSADNNPLRVIASASAECFRNDESKHVGSSEVFENVESLVEGGGVHEATAIEDGIVKMKQEANVVGNFRNSTGMMQVEVERSTSNFVADKMCEEGGSFGDRELSTNYIDDKVYELIGNVLPIVNKVPVRGDDIHNDSLDGSDPLEGSDCFSFESIRDDMDDSGQGLSAKFDINVLKKSVEESAETLELVNGKDVVLVVGKTGVGKSTLIQGIAGKAMKTAVYESSFSGHTALKTVFVADDALDGFKIGHDTKSMTSSLNAFLHRNQDNKDVIYLDSPGMEDTNGIEMDVATCALLSQVAKRCKSLKFIVVIHCASLLEDRGGAFRSVLTFARKFALDFNQSKRSFMFLFSHSNEIAEMSDSQEHAVERLRDEITRTAKGTNPNDKDVLVVLQFILESLRKGYPFAGVFHPLEMDFSNLTSSVEKKLKKMTDLSLASSCNLSTASKLKLDGAVQKLVQSLRVALRESSPDPAQVRDVSSTLCYLDTYIDIDCVRYAASEGKIMIDEYIAMTKSLIDGHALKGLSSDTGFGIDNVRAIKEFLELLHQLDESFCVSQWHLKNRSRLLKFKQEVLEKVFRAAPVDSELEKFALWAKEFKEYSEVYANICSAISEFFKSLAEKLSVTDFSRVDKGSSIEITEFINCLSTLDDFCDRATQFSFEHVSVKDLTLTRNSILIEMRKLFEMWVSNAAQLQECGTFISIVRYVKGLDSIEDALKQHPSVCLVLLDQTQSARKEIEQYIVDRVTSCCTRLLGTTFHTSWSPYLFWLRDACHHFSDARGETWRTMESYYFSVIDKAKTDVSKMAGDLVMISTLTLKHGISNGDKLAKECMDLESFKWFDDFITPGRDSISGYIAKVNSAIDARILDKKLQVDDLIKSLVLTTSKSCEFLEQIGHLLPELRNIDKFLIASKRLAQDAIGLSLKCIAHVEEYVVKLSGLVNIYIKLWADGFGRGRVGFVRSMSRKLNDTLRLIQTLCSINVSCDVELQCDNIANTVVGEFKKCTSIVESEFSAFKGIMEKKVIFMTSIYACKEFTFVANQLPRWNQLQLHLRDLVSREAQDIEQEIESSSDWEIIDNRLLYFESAVVLDSFVGQEVTARLQTLLRMRDQKENSVGDLLQNITRDCNFQHIGAVISPLAESKDQIKKQKFEVYRNEICINLENIIHEVNNKLDLQSSPELNSQTIGQKIYTLVQAKSELQNLLKPRLNLSSEVEALKKKATQVLDSFTENLIKATNAKDFTKIVLCRRQANQFKHGMEPHVYKKSLTKFEIAREKAKQAIQSVPKYVQEFFNSSFERVDELARVLTSLKYSAEMEGSLFEKLREVYDDTKKDIEIRTRQIMSEVSEMVKKHQVYEDAICFMYPLQRQLKGPLKKYCTTDLIIDCDALLDSIRQAKHESDHWFEFDGEHYHLKIEQWSKKLDNLNHSAWHSYLSLVPFRGKNTYEVYRTRLIDLVKDRFDQACMAIKRKDLQAVQECIEFLECIEKYAKKHVDIVEPRLKDVCDLCIAAFLKLCKQAEQFLRSSSPMQFEKMFFDYQSFTVKMACIHESKDCKKAFALVNQLLFEVFEHEIGLLHQTSFGEENDFSVLKSRVLSARTVGNFYADHLTVLHEQTKDLMPDKWLRQIHELCWKHCNVGRDLRNVKYCVLLGVPPSATAVDINKAFKEKALKYHPDKCPGDGALFRATKEAHDKLVTMSHLMNPTLSQPFDEILTGLGEKLRRLSKTLLQQQRYAQVEKLLFHLPNLKILADLVVPSLAYEEIISSIYQTVSHHVEKGRVEVVSSWNSRNYKELNDVIIDLKQMEIHFKSYPQIFSESWDRGISRNIEEEIESLGDKIRLCLKSHVMAKQKEKDFRRYFIEMGFVLVELPAYKSFTKSVMSNVLESCLDKEWGYGYLFELGLSLQKSDDSCSDDENRIAQMIITEFSHFKEVMTMVWNEETSQKPAEDVVALIKGELEHCHPSSTAIKINTQSLLDSFNLYDLEYKSLLGDYLKADADLKILVHKTLVLANEVKPSSESLEFCTSLKVQIPVLLASVFVTFTVLKSGASYNRIEAAGGSSELGIKLLMKPHNIQVLTLLYMFGCGTDNYKYLENQLMQIRTGEGKSMILGAAAVMLTLLGFQVRTVCYSEYLSTRDFKLFEEVFDIFGLKKYIKYSKITKFAEDSTAAKGNIRNLTESLLRGNLHMYSPVEVAASEELSTDMLHRDAIIEFENSNKIQHELESQHCDSDRNTKRLVDGSTDLDNQPLHKNTSQLDSSKDSYPTNRFNSINSANTKVGISEAHREYVNSTRNEKSFKLCQPPKNYNFYSSKTVLATPIIDSNNRKRMEVLLVDEVDVFFGSEFYGQTYNKVVQFREPEIADILKRIWNAFSKGGRRLILSDIQSMPSYLKLSNKLPAYLLDNEILLMLDQVRRVDEVPYYVDADNDRIGYKVMDTISYDVTYGYATIFAHLKESDHLKKETVMNALMIPISCGQFSYANISPYRIIGVSGTLQALGDYERDVLGHYGLTKFIYAPSVYGDSNFAFDTAGDGIFFEDTQSNFYHRIFTEITSQTKNKRAVIVFFRDRANLDDFVASPTYRQLGRHKKLLTEDLSSADKEYIVNKAATAKQITLCTAVFGRGTDFFCKDEAVERNGGVHIIQTFLSKVISEEIQIQGRTARQGKRGTYQMVLLDSDLESDFGVPPGERSNIPRRDWYNWLCDIRNRHHKRQCKIVEKNIERASDVDKATHKYFDSLLACDTKQALVNFEALYLTIKKPPFPSLLNLDLAFAIDITGSMMPFTKSILATINGLLDGPNSIVGKLKVSFPEISFRLHTGCLGYRDIDDKKDQFEEVQFADGSHFTESRTDAMTFINDVLTDVSGGFDLAEDHLGAIQRCTTGWNHSSDWSSEIKFIIMFTDSPAHCFVPGLFSGSSNYDSYDVRHPNGLGMNHVVSSLVAKNIDLVFCSFNPAATEKTEEELSLALRAHPDCSNENGITRISMVPENKVNPSLTSGCDRHIIFVLDESGSMQHNWNGVEKAYNEFIHKRQQSQCDADLVSVVQFNNRARITVNPSSLSFVPDSLPYNGGGTCFYPAAVAVTQIVRQTLSSFITPTIIFMSDGQAGDSDAAAQEFSALNSIIVSQTEKDLELHVVAFGTGTDNAQLWRIARSSNIGKVYSSLNAADLAQTFVSIASNQDVATLLESEITKRISEAVSDKLSLEYFGS